MWIQFDFVVSFFLHTPLIFFPSRLFFSRNETWTAQRFCFVLIGWPLIIFCFKWWFQLIFVQSFDSTVNACWWHFWAIIWLSFIFRSLNLIHSWLAASRIIFLSVYKWFKTLSLSRPHPFCLAIIELLSTIDWVYCWQFYTTLLLCWDWFLFLRILRLNFSVSCWASFLLIYFIGVFLNVAGLVQRFWY